MIDTISAGHSFYAQDCERVLSRLSQVQEMVKRETGEVSYRGKANNLIVNVKPAGSIFITGSLCKYHLGSNAQTLTRRATNQAIECLSDALGIDMKQASIYRLDVGENIILNHPVREYVDRLGGARWMRKAETYKGGKMYSNGTGSMLLYDKQLEMRKNREVLPDVFLKFPNILRIERQYHHRLGKTFKRNGLSIIGSDLSEEGFYIGLVNGWKESYQSIEKLKQSAEVKLNSVRNLKASALTYMVQSIGVEPLTQIIEADRQAGNITRKTKYKLLEAIRGSVKVKKKNRQALGIMQELDEKVSSAAMFYR